MEYYFEGFERVQKGGKRGERKRGRREKTWYGVDVVAEEERKVVGFWREREKKMGGMSHWRGWEMVVQERNRK